MSVEKREIRSPRHHVPRLARYVPRRRPRVCVCHSHARRRGGAAQRCGGRSRRAQAVAQRYAPPRSPRNGTPRGCYASRRSPPTLQVHGVRPTAWLARLWREQARSRHVLATFRRLFVARDMVVAPPALPFLLPPAVRATVATVFIPARRELEWQNGTSLRRPTASRLPTRHHRQYPGGR